MASQAALVESRRLRGTTQVALAGLAANAYRQAGVLWLTEVGRASSAAAGGAAWVAKMIRVLRVWRRQAMQIAAAHAALDEGLRTGSVAGVGDIAGRDSVPSSLLRSRYRKLIQDFVPEAFGTGDGYEPWAGGIAAEYKILPAPDLKALFSEVEALWEKEAREQLLRVAEENVRLADRVKVRDNVPDKTADLDGRRAVENDVAAKKAGTAVAHNLQSSARDVTFKISQAGRNVVGWARKNFPINGSQPCAFCVMLLSRGVSYKSGKSAGGDIGGAHSFHPNCRCQAVPIYKGEIYWEMPEFEDNRQALKLYQEHYPSNGKSDRARFNTFRRAIDARNRVAKRS